MRFYFLENKRGVHSAGRQERLRGGLPQAIRTGVARVEERRGKG